MASGQVGATRSTLNVAVAGTTCVDVSPIGTSSEFGWGSVWSEPAHVILLFFTCNCLSFNPLSPFDKTALRKRPKVAG